MNAPTDESLVCAYLSGDVASFELLVRRHAQELHQFAQRFTGSSAAAEDVVQETFLKVHTSADRFDPTRRFKPWLFTIAANKARDHLRRRDRKREVPFDAHIGGEGEGGGRFVDLLVGVSVLPFAELARGERRRTVRLVVETMPGKLREVLVLAYYHDFPYKEIADVLGIPLGTVKSRLHAAVAIFAEQYKAMAEASVDKA